MSTISQAVDVAMQYLQAGQFAQADSILRQVLAAAPAHADALHLLGVIAYQQRDYALAIERISQAIQLQPGAARFYNNLGVALCAAGRCADALRAHEAALRLEPGQETFHYNHGNTLLAADDAPAAIRAYQAALKIAPNLPVARNMLGVAFVQAGQIDDAIAAFQRAIAEDPNYPDAYNNLGNAYKDQGLLDPAIEAYRKSLALNPNDAEVRSNLINLLQFHPEVTLADIQREHCEWRRIHERPLRSTIAPHTNSLDPHKRLRIGYASADFRNHCQVFFMMPLLAHHDPRQFEIFCYSGVRQPDAFTAQLRGLAGQWRDISSLPDEQAAELIRQDQIDILVDLTQHMAYNRLPLFARRPAPVQAAWLGYPGSTGLETMDFRLTDPHLDPPGTANQAFYSEQSIRLPDAFWCYDPLSDVTVSELPALTRGHITFGSLNNFCKVNPKVIDLWARVMQRVAGSRMLILTDHGAHRARTLELFRQAALDNAQERIEFVAKCQRREYLELCHRIDIILDTFPYNGHTTSLDALWMGVPVVSILGSMPVGRAGLSILTNLALADDWLATTPEQFMEIAVRWSQDLQALAALRRSLRTRLQSSPLMDAARFAKNMEAAYREMWMRRVAIGKAQ
jgi:predicted O-linked N-acetylglucosamine transferase (SPINDLY family)